MGRSKTHSGATRPNTAAQSIRKKVSRSARTSAGSHATTKLRDEVTAYRKDLIVRAACDAFFEHGYHDCTVDMIAERLSGTKAIVYYYFSDKQSILEEIYRRALGEARALICQGMSEGSDPQARLASFARLYARWVIANQRMVGIISREERSLSPETSAAVAIERKKIDDLVALMIGQGVATNQFRVHDVKTTARAIAGMISFTFTWWRDIRRLTRDDAAEYYAEMALRLVGIPPS